MDQLARLTPDQEAQLLEYGREWFQIATSTDPADRSRAEAALARVYESIGEPPPQLVWVNSPVSAPWSIRRGENLVDRLFFGRSWFASVWNSFRVSLEDPLRDCLDDSMRRWLRTWIGFDWGHQSWHLLRAALASSGWAPHREGFFLQPDVR